MPSKTQPSPSGSRGEPVRRRVIDAAERLLRDGKAEFSMRELAAEAGVSFATPFNQFGSKAAIMHALSERRIDTMLERFSQAAVPAPALDRVLLAVELAAGVMLEEPPVNRAVLSWLGTAGPVPGQVLAHSTTLWTLALGTGEGLAETRREEALQRLPRQLAFAFRGVLSFWTAGELPDAALASEARQMAEVLLLGLVERQPTEPDA
jgi:AcrR family transcriptional regulator